MKRPIEDPYGRGKLEYRGARVVDPDEQPFRSDEVFHDGREVLLRVYGILAHGNVFDPNFANIYTGQMLRQNHHNADGHHRTRDDFFGDPPRYGFCLEWDTYDGVRARCGMIMKLESQGCGKHRAVLGKGGNEVFSRIKHGEPIDGWMLMDPEVYEKEQEEEQNRLSKAEQEQAREDRVEAVRKQAEAEGIPEWKVWEREKGKDKARWKAQGQSSPWSWSKSKSKAILTNNTLGSPAFSAAPAIPEAPEQNDEPHEKDHRQNNKKSLNSKEKKKKKRDQGP